MHSLGPIANERVANLEDPMLVGGTQAELRRRVARSVARQDVSHLSCPEKAWHGYVHGGWIRTKSWLIKAVGYVPNPAWLCAWPYQAYLLRLVSFLNNDWVEVLQTKMQGYKIVATLELDVGNSL